MTGLFCLKKHCCGGYLNFSMNLVSFPGNSVILPPDNLMICLDMLRPMPLPPSLVVKKGMKICSATSGRITGPLFFTSMITSSASLQQAWMEIQPSVGYLSLV